MKRFSILITAIGSLFTLIHSASGALFVQSWSQPLPDGYAAAVAQDLNGDGKPDLVAPNGSAPGALIVATNAGNGIFITNGIYTVGNYPYSAAIADVNGDSQPDLIAANYGDNTVTVLTNAGGGIFVSNTAYAVGNGPASVSAMDINGDHLPDLIIANNTDGTLTILTNAGNGTFSPAQTVLVVNPSSSPQYIAIADLNGDGKPDLIAPDNSDSLILVLTNAGGGIFISNAVYAANYPTLVAAADFNNDGKTDIISGTTATIYTNAGNGQLVFSTTMPYAGDFAVMDVDGDGFMDLYINTGTFKKTIFNSSSGFLTNNIVSTRDTAFSSLALDINGDGKPDLVAAGNFRFQAWTNDVPNLITLTVSTNVITEATGPSGAVVNFTVTATNWTGGLSVTNTPPSGSTFPLGITTVTSSTAYFIKSNLTGSTNKTFTVTVQDTTPPTITVLGANPVTNFVDNYIDAGATATDIAWGDLTGSIIVSGDLNTNAPGNYTVTYSVTDGSGNTATANRTVVLLPLPPLGAASASGNQTALFWPITDNTNYVLQSSTNLASGDWEDVTNSVPVFAVEVTNAAPAMFFRLKPR
jgi:hypothetical protein